MIGFYAQGGLLLGPGAVSFGLGVFGGISEPILLPVDVPTGPTIAGGFFVGAPASLLGRPLVGVGAVYPVAESLRQGSLVARAPAITFTAVTSLTTPERLVAPRAQRHLAPPSMRGQTLPLQSTIRIPLVAPHTRSLPLARAGATASTSSPPTAPSVRALTPKPDPGKNTG